MFITNYINTTCHTLEAVVRNSYESRTWSVRKSNLQLFIKLPLWGDPKDHKEHGILVHNILESKCDIRVNMNQKWSKQILTAASKSMEKELDYLLERRAGRNQGKWSNIWKNSPGTRVHRATGKVMQIGRLKKNIRYANKDHAYLYLFGHKYLIQLATPGTKHFEVWDLIDSFSI